jgi:hypothetical protein
MKITQSKPVRMTFNEVIASSKKEKLKKLKILNKKVKHKLNLSEMCGRTVPMRYGSTF